MKSRKITVREFFIDTCVAVGFTMVLYFAQPYLYDCFVACFGGGANV